MVCEWTRSVFPAMSIEKNFTVLVLDTVNEPVDTGLDVVGVDPSVV